MSSKACAAPACRRNSLAAGAQSRQRSGLPARLSHPASDLNRGNSAASTGHTVLATISATRAAPATLKCISSIKYFESFGRVRASGTAVTPASLPTSPATSLYCSSTRQKTSELALRPPTVWATEARSIPVVGSVTGPHRSGWVIRIGRAPIRLVFSISSRTRSR